MNGYELSKNWYEVIDGRTDIKPVHHALLFWIIELSNRLRWPESFRLPTINTMEMIGVSNRRTYYGAFDKLVELGAIEIIEKSKNQFTANRIKLTLSACAQALPQAAPQKSGLPVQKMHKHCTHNKTIENNSIKTIKTYSIDFDRFWDLYDKKTGRKKCESKWKKLTEEEKGKIFEILPLYIASTPDKKYRKNPFTWLSGECWNDDPELLKSQIKNLKNNQNGFTKTNNQRHAEIIDNNKYKSYENGMSKNAGAVAA
ncbi:MAG: hypothetical protein AAFZ15_34335 [Bacteroidota bacterium]